MKRFFIILAALALAIIPASNVFAVTTIYSGTVNFTDTEPIAVTYGSCSAGTFNEGTHTWDVSVIGAGTVTLTMHVVNTNATSGYTVNAAVTPGTSTDGTITAVWTPAAKYLAPGGAQDFVLTVTAGAAVTPQVANFAINFTR